MPETPSAPTISVPKGGGAIQGIGETFAATPVTGTARLTLPLGVSPGRSGFTPRLELSYDSGSGNGPFGLGWSLSLPSITRRTDRGIPRYADVEEADTYVLSSAEDLVPVRADRRDGHSVTRYRPRLEGAFSIVERWRRDSDGDTHWRTISNQSITSFYGSTSASRIADPAQPSRVFSWLIDRSQDAIGNVMVYEYAAENGEGVDRSRAAERNRTDENRGANRYIKRVKYGNVQSLLTAPLASLSWMFEVVFDYGEGHLSPKAPDADKRVYADASLAPSHARSVRRDSFSRYRPGFECRTSRLCRRVLMFHHFAEELGTPDYLVRTSELGYDENPVATMLTSLTQSGCVRQNDGRYLVVSKPPLELEYSAAVHTHDVRDVDAASLVNLPSMVDGQPYRWLDLDGEGAPSVLAEQGDGWYYKRNLSPLELSLDSPPGTAQFEQLTDVTRLPAAAQSGARHEFLDLAGDGALDCVLLARPGSGFYERGGQGRWQSFATLASAPNIDWADPNLRLVDVDGDGRTDVLITGGDSLTYYLSRGSEGFDAPCRVPKDEDEERGPAVVFADETHSVFLADMSGDGLSDIVRIRNGEVCYWPNLGYGQFGPKVTMDGAPWFDAPDEFDPRRLRLADIDGAGVADLVYLGATGVRLYENQSGNAWDAPMDIANAPAVDKLAAIQVLDLLGNGTACLVWTTADAGDGEPSMRYIDLMGGRKPYLLTRTANNLGAETRISYLPSTTFHLADREAGRPWVTRLPFPVQVVARVERYDFVSRNRFVTRYSYHHGYFDGAEREFRGFGMVEQRDTEELGALTTTGAFPSATNVDEASYVAPVVTKTWFHTGAYPSGRRVSRVYDHEFAREPGLSDAQSEAMRLPDSALPSDLSGDEIHEALRALKGAVLRQEVYALDGTAAETLPYQVTESNYTIDRLQPLGTNRHAVFYMRARESLTFAYERAQYVVAGDTVADPRVTHTMSLAVDEYGNELLAATIGYGRRHDATDPLLTPIDRAVQRATSVTYTERAFTNPVLEMDAYRTPALADTRTFELVNVSPSAGVAGVTNLFRFDELASLIALAGDGAHDVAYSDFAASSAVFPHPYRRRLSGTRAIFRADDLSGALQLGVLQPLGLPFAAYTLALTPDIIALYQRGADILIPAPPTLLGATAGYIQSDDLVAAGFFPLTDPSSEWWVRSGRVFYSPSATDTPAQELAVARAHFFTGRRFSDSLDNETVVTYDGAYDLLPATLRDSALNTVTARNDYRVVAPALITDPNGNRVETLFDAHGLVVATATMGKTSENVGDSLAGIDADLTRAQTDGFFANPTGPAAATLLGGATTRIVYDLGRFARLTPTPSPVYAATISRETHASELAGGASSKLQVRVSYSDGFGREIQRKAQAEPGPLTLGGPAITPRWIGSGWTVLNNKGKPVRQYEPFFDSTHDFAYGVAVGVSPTILYDPLNRATATLRPNATWEKTVIDPWGQEHWDAIDTVLVADPSVDPNVGADIRRLPAPDYLPTWYARRIGGALGPDEQDAAQKAAQHAGTPATSHFDNLGRVFLTLAFNGTSHARTGTTRDVQGQVRSVIDPLGRTLVTYDYDLRGTRIRETSLDGATRWMLSDAAAKAFMLWDSRGHRRRHEYDALQRPVALWVQEGGGGGGGGERQAERTVYGEAQPNDVALNLRGALYRSFDGAGIVTNVQYDFKGNLLTSTRQLVAVVDAPVDWAGAPGLTTDAFATQTTFDALNRVVTGVSPDGTVVRPMYNEASLLAGVDVRLPGAAIWTPFVSQIAYNARAQRDSITYGNGAKTTLEHDPLTARLTTVTTTRTSDGATLQALRYTYDPVGNVTRLGDDAQQTTYFANAVVSPDVDYVYDALYRLTTAEGRELIGLTAAPQTTDDDVPRMQQPLPTDASAMRRYTERYQYDDAGNILSLAHVAAGGNWTRLYAYDEPNVPPATNRLTSTTVGGLTDSYTYDPHGNIATMPQLADMAWDYKDQLRLTQRQAGAGTGERTYYHYDHAGQRVRKVTRSASGGMVRERIYLGGFEVYREYGGGGSVSLERTTFHVMDADKRLAIVETQTAGGTATPAIRYQFSNQLESATLELDESAAIISYEEYYPFGATSYQGARSVAEVSLKRYRYIGRERDRETGLAYHGARYYACWLGRWVSCDALGLAVGGNPYAYANSNPIGVTDRSGLSGSGADGDLEDGGLAGTTQEGLQQGKLDGAVEFQRPPEELPKADTAQPAATTGTGAPQQQQTPPPKAKPTPKAPKSDTTMYIDLPQAPHAGDKDDIDFITFEMDPDKVTLPDILAGFYCIGYDIKQNIYNPIKNWVAPQPKLYLDSNQHVQVSNIPQSHDDAIIAFGQIALSLLPETRMGLGPAKPTAYMRFEGKMLTNPSDANFLRFGAEWAQTEDTLIRGERLPVDETARRLARNEMDANGISRVNLDAMHPLDSSAAGRFIKPGTDVGSTYYFGNRSVNRAFGGQLAREFDRLGIKIGQEFRLEFVGFPSYEVVPPMAPPASSPNLLMPR